MPAVNDAVSVTRASHASPAANRANPASRVGLSPTRETGREASPAEAITFAARRLHADPIALVLAISDAPQTTFDGSGFTELQLGGLDAEAAGALLDSGGPLEPGVRAEVLRIAQGNPLALLELPHALAGQQPGGQPLDEPVPLTPALEDAFLARVRVLPGPGAKRLRCRRRCTAALRLADDRSGDQGTASRPWSAGPGPGRTVFHGARLSGWWEPRTAVQYRRRLAAIRGSARYNSFLSRSMSRVCSRSCS
jgi:hypothetical protein